MIQLRDIYSLTDFQRKTREHLDRLKATGRPEVLTVNGRAEVVVRDAAAYERLLDVVARAEAIVGIRLGLDAMHRGEGLPTAQALRSIAERHREPRDG